MIILVLAPVNFIIMMSKRPRSKKRLQMSAKLQFVGRVAPQRPQQKTGPLVAADAEDIAEEKSLPIVSLFTFVGS